jgi:hydroxymethylpyrimidine/phosphomethylpyrimidine kinase
LPHKDSNLDEHDATLSGPMKCFLSVLFFRMVGWYGGKGRRKIGMKPIPRALTIAGSDSGGGAGIQADLKTFQELFVYGMSALTAITAQNTRGVQSVYPLPPEAVRQQILSVLEDIGADVVKTGMLATLENMKTVAETLSEYPVPHVVVDPVMVSTSGHSLLDEEARTAFQTWILPLATVITPNIPEAERLTGLSLEDESSRRRAARLLVDMGARTVVLKGGHLTGEKADDLFFDGKDWHVLSAPRLPARDTHGTGCTFAAALAAFLARGFSPLRAAEEAKRFITAAIATSLRLGGGRGPTNHWAYREQEAEK